MLTVSLVYFVYYIYHSIIILEVVELLQRHNYSGYVDVSLLATWEQVRERKRQKQIFTVEKTVHCLSCFNLFQCHPLENERVLSLKR